MKRLVVSAALLSFALHALGQADEFALQTRLQAAMPGNLKIEKISLSPVQGLYEVVAGKQVFYIDANAQFLVRGEIIEVKTNQNLTQLKIDKLGQIEFDKLPFKDAIVVTKGNGSQKLAIFTDPNCAYCKVLEQTFAQMDDVTIYVFIYPILNQDSKDKAKSIVCSTRPSKQWQDWMLRGVLPDPPRCDQTDALQRNIDFGRSHRILAIPTLVMSNGTTKIGVVEPKQLQTLISQAKKS